jgi:hypothetical protein
MTSFNVRQQAFRRILVREAGTGADASAIAAAARRLCERFAHQLAPLLGDAGVTAIYARSLHLALQQLAGLAPVQVSKRDNGPFTLAQHFLEHQEPAVAAEAAVALLTTVTELLASFIGDRLTVGLLRQAWPHDFADDTTEETPT